jgi:hypothetical protein
MATIPNELDVLQVDSVSDQKLLIFTRFPFQQVSFFFPTHSFKAIQHTCGLRFLENDIFYTCLAIRVSSKRFDVDVSFTQ